MNQSIAGYLIYKKPNKFTQPSQVSPGLHIVMIPSLPFGVSNEESFMVGTRCGTVQFHQDRVNEYIAYKRGEKPMVNIIFQNDLMLTLAEYNRNWRYYYNRQMRRWFGEDLIDYY